ncbi:MAG: sigma-70 family RNA polymerase sigma factor [Planctomycetota bacterium]
MESPAVEITRLLQQARGGDSAARDQLLRTIYDELRTIARRLFRGERADHTLEATALVNEVCLRLLATKDLPGQNRAQFGAYVAKAMRSLLIDHARQRASQKRGGQARHVRLDSNLVVGSDPRHELLALDEALNRLSTVDARRAKVVELRYFGGLSVEEVCEVLDVSAMTVKRDWQAARAWLLAELKKD